MLKLEMLFECITMNLRAHVASVDGEFLEQLSVFISGTISFHREGHRHQKRQGRQKVHPYVFDVNLGKYVFTVEYQCVWHLS